VGGLNVHVEAPVTRLVCGIKPETLGDLEESFRLCGNPAYPSACQSCHTGQEGSNIDFESKVFQAGMIDHVGMEVADIAQIASYGFPKADPEAPLSGFGLWHRKRGESP
jgi:acetyl-CoA decarbonylase/synthase complex subunit alpha